MNNQLNSVGDATGDIVGDIVGDASDFDGVLDRPLGVSRRDALLRTGGMGALLALGGLPIALAGISERAYGQAALSQQVIDVLNFALTLEMLESTFYNMGMGTSGLIPSADRTVFGQIQKHENDHVAFLQSALGSNAIGPLQFDFTAGGMFNPFGDYPTFLVLSQGFEDTGVRAYKGQATNLMSNGTILTYALRIHSVEARHASEVRRIRGEKGWITGADPTAPMALAAVYAGEDNTMQGGIDVSRFLGADAATEAFDEPLDKTAVLAIAGPFIKAS